MASERGSSGINCVYSLQLQQWCVTINVTRVGNNDGVKIDITNGGTDNDGVTTNVINYGANYKRQQWCNTKCYK